MSKKLDYKVYTVTEREGQDKSYWTKIGAAFVNKDGSINVALDALPVNGRIQLREPHDEPAENAEV